MTPTTHTTRLTELLEKQQSTRIQTGIKSHDGAIRGIMFCALFEAIAVLVAVAIWYFSR